jgi:mannose-1-phosphate guanylyltransferase / phosphomannomutase
MKPAIFIDRDGTLNREVDVLRDIKQLEVLPNVAAPLKQLSDLGFLIIIITNQPVIARGWLTPAQVEEINAELVHRITIDGGVVDAVYYCPHHPNANLPEYRAQCDCRKPNIGLFNQAMKKHDIDMSKSFMIGDSTGDILAGQRAGVKTILVETGYAGKDDKYEVKPDFQVEDLAGAVNIIKTHVSKN